MCKKKQKKKYPPLQPRQGPYLKTNAYTNKYSIEQVITFILPIIVVILHSIFNVAAICKIDHPILYIMLAMNYLLILGLIITYVKITIFDPVDSYIINPVLAQVQKKKQRVKYCVFCQSTVHLKSYHCKRCKRCTQDFDHHCVYLNSCIGSKNYQMFLRILFIFILFLLNNIGQSIWVFVAARNSSAVQTASITQWMSIVIIIMCVLQLLATLILLGFHLYISCCLDVTTLMFMESDASSTKKDKLSIDDRVQTHPNQDYQSPDPYIRSKLHTSAQQLASSGIMV